MVILLGFALLFLQLMIQTEGHSNFQDLNHLKNYYFKKGDNGTRWSVKRWVNALAEWNFDEHRFF